MISYKKLILIDRLDVLHLQDKVWDEYGVVLGHNNGQENPDLHSSYIAFDSGKNNWCQGRVK